MSHDIYGDDDPWGTGTPRVLSGPGDDTDAAAYAVTELDDITPLDAQMGVAEKRTVPDALAPYVFGGAPGRMTYAILDAAKVSGLAETLENSDLPHDCLFANADDLGAVAPWLVQLEPDAALTRNLFTRANGPPALWDADAGVLLRSRMALPALRAHLRRFTMAQTDAPEPVFFRFWDPRVMARYLGRHSDSARDHVRALLGDGDMIAIDRHNDRAVHAASRAPEASVPQVWPDLHADLAPIRLEIFCEDLADRIATVIPQLADVPRAERRETITALVHAARRIDLRANKSVERYCYATLMIGQQPETDPRFAELLQSDRHELDRSRLMLKRAKDL